MSNVIIILIPLFFLLLGAIGYILVTRAQYGILLVILSLPFVNTAIYKDYRLPDLVASIVIILYVTNMVITKRTLVKPKGLTLPIILFLFVSFVSVLRSSLFLESFNNWVILIYLTCLLLICHDICTKYPELLKKGVQCWILISIFVSIVTILEGLLLFGGIKLPKFLTVYGHIRAAAFFTDANFLGNYLLISSSLLISIFTFCWPRRKLIYTAMLLLNTIAIFFTFSRGAYIGLVFLTVYNTLLIRGYYHPQAKGRVTIVGWVLLAFLCYFLFFKALPTGLSVMRNRVSTIFNIYDPSNITRLMSWQYGINLMLNNPLGIGLDMYDRVYVNPLIMQSMMAHCTLITIGAEMGILGLCIYLWFMVKVFQLASSGIKKQGNELQRALGYGFLGAFLSINIQGLTIDILYQRYLWVLTGMVISLNAGRSVKGKVKIPSLGESNFTHPCYRFRPLPLPRQRRILERSRHGVYP